MGRTKQLERAGDQQRLLEHMIKLSETHFDFETAAELREQLMPAASTTVDTEPAYTAPPKAKRRKRKGKAPAPSEDWCHKPGELRAHHHQDRRG